MRMSCEIVLHVFHPWNDIRFRRYVAIRKHSIAVGGQLHFIGPCRVIIIFVAS
jgi:hypothetical protein